MSLEPGGRAEKYGDEYENRYLTILLLRVVNESLSNIIVEPIGENSDSVEFITEDKFGISGYYQCKASNKTKPAWSIADLKRYAVFTRIKNILSDNANAHYYFISPLAYNELDEICKRARTTLSAKDLMDYQLTNDTIRRTFKDCARAFQLDINCAQDMDAFVALLSRCYFEQCPNGTEAVRDLEERISLMFTGEASEVRILLEQFSNSTGNYGKRISAKDIIDYLESLNIHVRITHFDNRILTRIKTLNDIYWDTCPTINGQLIHREATSKIINRIKEGGSVILHGKAGSGKSGCLQETINQLKQDGILYLAIKLDKIVPETSADEFGRKLGLPESPVYCLARHAGDSPCVLILDQLDVLRWTTSHSATALSICKELISQTEVLNNHEGKSISIVFASRTFDLENDSGLKALFNRENSQGTSKWKKISIDNFTQSEVVQLIGNSYYQLSSRLQKLLLTPASLYVWTQLETSKRKNNVSSMHQLMRTWWTQIIESSDAKGIAQKRMICCKNKIVRQMEQNTIFSLPMALFVDDEKAIFNLISNGMIRTDGTNISFVHQSFLDFFITFDYLSKIYDGDNVVDLIEPYDKQIPQVRYRLVSVLQNLIESNQDMFVQQGRSILESSGIHYYFQCAVFEVIGQCDTPQESIYSLVDQYALLKEWNTYIIQVVYSAHPVFLKHLAEQGCDWLEDTNLLLLKSINSKDPDFVVNTLRSYEIDNIEDARRIHWTLCPSIADDSDDMFQFRIELLKRYPVLLDDYYGIPDLYIRNPLRAIQLLKIILGNSSSHKFMRVYLGEKKHIGKFTLNHNDLIIKELFPLICQKTNSLTITWQNHYSWLSNDHQDWFADNIKKSVLREIVDITKGALAEYAIKYPNKLCELIKEYQLFSSAICHELLSHAILCLPEEQGNFTIQWLLHNFNAKVFVFTDNQEDYLSYTKQIIQKFSSICSSTLFQKLESTICRWKDSSKTMCDTYKRRIEINKSQQYDPYYVAFWGHMQKELLPCLDITRMSRYSRELLQLLNRNTWVRIPHFNSGITFSPVKTVISPIHNHVEQISDASWLRIISAPIDKMSTSWQGKDQGSDYFIETDHRAFSDSLRKQAEREPARFAQLSLNFPDGCYVGYVLGVLDALREADKNDNPVDIDLISQIIRRFNTIPDHNVAIAIARVVEHLKKEAWPDDILDLIAEIATKHPNPQTDEYSITNRDDPEHFSIRTLQENEINCARGCALHAIAALVWENGDLMERFKPTASIGCCDKNPAVRFAALHCLLPFFQSDSDFVVAKLRQLLNTDLRIIGAHDFWNLLSQDYQNNKQAYRDILLEACRSNFEDLSEVAAGMLCALAIFTNDDQAYEAITSFDFSFEQQNKICKQAVSSFDIANFHTRSKEILLTFSNKTTKYLSSFNQLFYEKRISIQRDSDFLICLMKSRQNQRLLYSFVNYLNKSDEDICQFAEALKTLADSLADSPFCGYERLDVQNFVQCVVRLSDRSKDNPAIQKICLEIWDNLFKNNWQYVKPISDMIDYFE
ncbi:MAG: hypothetical protein K6B40_08215 [Firmicutes bacterium]|nr:hypothetical protein [Bacillota bacterium]